MLNVYVAMSLVNMTSLNAAALVVNASSLRRMLLRCLSLLPSDAIGTSLIYPLDNSRAKFVSFSRSSICQINNESFDG